MEKANKDLIYKDVNMKMPEFPRVTKEDFMSQYEKYKDSPELALNLYIHMPDDSTEIIFNSQGHNKVEYINSTYDDNMTHKNSKDIYVIGFEFFSDKVLEYGFDIALKVIQRGKRVARRGWNGKNMFIYYVPKGEYAPQTKAAAKNCVNEKGLVPYGAYIAMKTVDGTVVPWLASQTDMLATDWYTV